MIYFAQDENENYADSIQDCALLAFKMHTFTCLIREGLGVHY